jgi:hypothetical protein
MPELGGKDYVYRSKNLSVADIQTKLAGLQIAAATNRVDPRQIVETVNEVADLDLEATDKPVVDPGVTSLGTPAVNDTGFKVGMGIPGSLKAKVPINDGMFKPAAEAKVTAVQKDDGFNVLMLADQAMVALRKRDLATLTLVIGQVDHLSKNDLQSFKAAMALRQYFNPSVDPEGMTDLASCNLVAMLRSQELG